MNAAASRPDLWTRFRSPRRRRAEDQVAAVCYRIGRHGIEFLLVQTRGSRRWTFPKGGVNPRMTAAEAAAREAVEEAGVHGRIEETPFARYVRRARGRATTVQAYLCEVLRRARPHESRRAPTWFAAEKARHRLGEGRSAADAAEFARVVDRAISIVHARLAPGRTGPGCEARGTFLPGRSMDGRRISASESGRDALHKVTFEDPQRAAFRTQAAQAYFAHRSHPPQVVPNPQEIDVEENRPGKLLPFAPSRPNRNPRLLPPKR